MSVPPFLSEFPWISSRAFILLVLLTGSLSCHHPYWFTEYQGSIERKMITDQFSVMSVMISDLFLLPWRVFHFHIRPHWDFLPGDMLYFCVYASTKWWCNKNYLGQKENQFKHLFQKFILPICLHESCCFHVWSFPQTYCTLHQVLSPPTNTHRKPLSTCLKSVQLTSVLLLFLGSSRSLLQI